MAGIDLGSRERWFENWLESLSQLVRLDLWPKETTGALKERALVECFTGYDGRYFCDVKPYAARWDTVLREASKSVGGAGACLAALDRAFLELEELGYGTAHCIVGNYISSDGGPELCSTDLFYCHERTAGLKGVFYSRLSDVVNTTNAPGTLPIYYASKFNYETPGQLRSLLEDGLHPSWEQLKVSKRHLKDVDAAKSLASKFLERAGFRVEGDTRWRHRLLVSEFFWDGSGRSLRSGVRWLSREKIASGPWDGELPTSPGRPASPATEIGLKLYLVPPALPRPRQVELQNLADWIAEGILIEAATSWFYGPTHYDRSDIFDRVRENAEEAFLELTAAEFEEVVELVWATYIQESSKNLRTGRRKRSSTDS